MSEDPAGSNGTLPNGQSYQSNPIKPESQSIPHPQPDVEEADPSNHKRSSQSDSLVDPQLESMTKRAKPESSKGNLSLNKILSPQASDHSKPDTSSSLNTPGELGSQTAGGASSVETNDDSVDPGGNTNNSNNHNAGINRAILDNIEGTPIAEDSSLIDDTLIKTNPRTKLGVQDIRIILYLIISIKPFKYIGDRTLSQTKKWELIQSEFSKYKQQKNQSNTIIPTIRTLQRQLSAAIKKAKQRRKSILGANDQETPLFKTITMDHSLDDLELASLELFELSETLKNGKLANSSLLEYSLILSNEIDANDKKLDHGNLFSESHSDQSVSRPASTSTSGSTSQAQQKSQVPHPQQPLPSRNVPQQPHPQFAHQPPPHPSPYQQSPPPGHQFPYHQQPPASGGYSASPIPNPVFPMQHSMPAEIQFPGYHSHGRPPQPLLPLPLPQHAYRGSVPGNVPGASIAGTSDPGSFNPPVRPEVLNELNDTRKSLKALISKEDNDKHSSDDPKPDTDKDKLKHKGHDIVQLLESLIDKSNRLQQDNHNELLKLIDRNNRMIELNKRFQVEQSDINKSLISDVVTYLKEHPSVPKDTINSIYQMI